jgi:hypothetical protein
MPTAGSNSTVTLDWSKVHAPQETHACNCPHCDLTVEPVEMQPLVVGLADDASRHVTNRFVLIREDLAPVPPNYEGTLITGQPNTTSLAALMTRPTLGPPTGLAFHSSVLRVLELTGWDLRLVTGEEGVTRPKVVVVDTAGTPVGVATTTDPAAFDARLYTTHTERE